MESISVFDIFKIGVGPSSSHTMGPWRAAQQFLAILRTWGEFDQVQRLHVDLYGSLAKTGRGHGTDLAVLLGLSGQDPVTCDPATIHPRVAQIRASGQLPLDGGRLLPFQYATDLQFHRDVTLPQHANGLRFEAMLDDGRTHAETFYSIGGGFVVREGDESAGNCLAGLPMPIETSSDLIGHCRAHGLTIPAVVRANERTWRTDAAIDAGLAQLWDVMRRCVHRGCYIDGILPGGLNVVRRAATMNRRRLKDESGVMPGVDEWVAAIQGGTHHFRDVLGWVSCFALAVNEENAAFSRVVTAPTNGAAGVIPAVLLYHVCFSGRSADTLAHDVVNFLLTAGEVGSMFKKGATISAAMGGCQAEIGVSSAMAASGLAQVSGGSVDQVLMAAEIAMEHHLGLTCDPIGGLVQIPCIERNSMGAIKAITACDMALAGDPRNARVTLDAVIRSMWATAQDMNTKYKETSEGGLAIQIPVSLSEC